MPEICRWLELHSEPYLRSQPVGFALTSLSLSVPHQFFIASAARELTCFSGCLYYRDSCGARVTRARPFTFLSLYSARSLSSRWEVHFPHRPRRHQPQNELLTIMPHKYVADHEFEFWSSGPLNEHDHMRECMSMSVIKHVNQVASLFVMKLSLHLCIFRWPLSKQNIIQRKHRNSVANGWFCDPL